MQQAEPPKFASKTVVAVVLDQDLIEIKGVSEGPLYVNSFGAGEKRAPVPGKSKKPSDKADETRNSHFVMPKMSNEQSVAAQRLAAIVESADDAIISKDLNGIVTSWNPAAQRIFGYTAEEMLGRPILTIIPPELQDDEPRILRTIASGKRIDHFETVRLTKNGKRLDISLTISPVKDESGRIVGAAKIARDITQQKKTEQALRTSERLASVGRLAATIAHEINNPLEAVTNLVYLASRPQICKKLMITF